MANLIVTIIILAILGASTGYIVKEKKRGVKCIGCPAAGNCAHKDEMFNCSCGCHSDINR